MRRSVTKILLYVLAVKPLSGFAASTIGDTFKRGAGQSLHGFLHTTGTIGLGAVAYP